MANQSLVRHVNERRLLGALRIAGPLSRAELARRLSLTRASVTGMVDDLFARGFVVEDAAAPADGRRDVGRPGIALRLAPGGAYFLGVEIGVGVIRLALIDLTGRPVETESHRVAEDIAPEAVITLLRSRVDAFRQHPAFGPRLSGIGVTVPGLVSRTGHVVNLPILGWRDVPFGAALAEVLALPVFLENNANAAAFGHIYADPGAGSGVLVYLKIGTGCGGAVVIDNKLMRGSHGLGAEIGHLRVAPDGPPCKCGQRGCLETFVNLKALNRYASDFGLVLEGTDAPAALRTRLDAGMPAARNVVSEIARYLVRGLSDITHLFNPDSVVIGGALLPVLDAIVAEAAPALARQMVPGLPPPRLIVSRIGAFECAIGAAALAHHEELDLANIDLSA